MTSERPLNASGSVSDFPTAELFAELFQQKLDGSLRVSSGEKKLVVYFRKGAPVFAVSNQRSARLFDMVLRRGMMTREAIVAVEGFTNDQVLAAHLRKESIADAEAIDRMTSEIVRNILIDALSWTAGDWEYDPLARAKDGIDSQIDLSIEINNYARHLSPEYILVRFRSFDERVGSVEHVQNQDLLTPQDGFLLSRLSATPIKLSDLIALIPTNETETLIRIYQLWLAGAVVRSGHRSPFGQELIDKLGSIRVELKREAENIHTSVHTTQSREQQHSDTTGDVTLDLPSAAPDAPFLPPELDEYLARFDGSKTYYDILGVAPDAEESAFRRSYFGLAKAFHPDHFHNADPDTFKRVQDAFAELAKAHETLRNAENRELYDFRVRKEIAASEERKKTGVTENVGIQLEQAEQSFDRGFNLLMNGDAAEALPLLGRAVHYAPKNARYHAYYGKALSADDTKRHKAEAAMQTAIKLDPDNANFRLMLAEFFVEVNLLRRAEGEVKRLLAIFPSNREAQALLADVQQRLGK